MSEMDRLADQIRRGFEGEAWHGDSVLEVLSGVDAKTAAAHPIRNAHSIWELLMHISAWNKGVVRRAGGSPVKLTDEENFPPVRVASEAAWQKTIEAAKQANAELVRTVAAFPALRLSEQVPGKSEPYYDFYYMFAGVVQHDLYHAGQIVMLKKAA
jgi:uncharacterized damage-inducible protein DinB